MQHTMNRGRTRIQILALPLCLALIGSAGAQSGSGSAALKSATKTAADIQSATGAKPSQKKVPAGDPCTVLPLSDVQKAFPGAKAGERSRRLEQYGTTECAWKTADGQIVLAVQESYSSGTAQEDVEGMAMGFTDPLKPQSRRNVRIEKFPGLGGNAAGFIEQADAKRGILSDGAILSVRRGEHAVWLMSSDLPRRDRSAALKSLEELGTVAAKRLQ